MISIRIKMRELRYNTILISKSGWMSPTNTVQKENWNQLLCYWIYRHLLSISFREIQLLSTVRGLINCHCTDPEIHETREWFRHIRAFNKRQQEIGSVSSKLIRIILSWHRCRHLLLIYHSVKYTRDKIFVHRAIIGTHEGRLTHFRKYKKPSDIP